MLVWYWAHPGVTFAERSHSWDYASMAVQITIRDVPEKVRNELPGRVASQGKSMRVFLRAELERLAARPSIETWLEQARSRKQAAGTRISAAQILKHRNADRR
jgi:antitoxin FitA